MKPTASSFQVSRKKTFERILHKHKRKFSSSFLETVSSFSFLLFAIGNSSSILPGTLNAATINRNCSKIQRSSRKMIVLLYKLQTLKAVDAKINGASKRHVLDDADLKVRTKYISTRNAKREMNLFFLIFF